MTTLIQGKPVQIKKGDKVLLRNGAIVEVLNAESSIWVNHLLVKNEDGRVDPVHIQEVINIVEDVKTVAAIIARIIKFVSSFFKKNNSTTP